MGHCLVEGHRVTPTSSRPCKRRGQSKRVARQASQTSPEAAGFLPRGCRAASGWEGRGQQWEPHRTGACVPRRTFSSQRAKVKARAHQTRDTVGPAQPAAAAPGHLVYVGPGDLAGRVRSKGLHLSLTVRIGGRKNQGFGGRHHRILILLSLLLTPADTHRSLSFPICNMGLVTEGPTSGHFYED